MAELMAEIANMLLSQNTKNNYQTEEEKHIDMCKSYGKRPECSLEHKQNAYFCWILTL